MEYTIKFTGEELQTVLNSLGEVPAKFSLHLILKIQQEVQLQKPVQQKQNLEN